MTYADFLTAKRRGADELGRHADPSEVHPALFDWQRDVVLWALRTGRAAIFADTGLGKTLMQLEWARLTGERALILTPLAVAAQTVRIARDLLGIDAQLCREQADVGDGINVANYERLHRFDAKAFGAVVLDEASIMKNSGGATKWQLVRAFEDTPWRLCCTATPAPNDWIELGNQAQFLGVMKLSEMLTHWFVSESGTFRKARLKRHGAAEFWRWVRSWAVAFTNPADLGYDGSAFVLPELQIVEHQVDVDYTARWGADPDGRLFPDASLSATNLHREMRLTATDRAERVAKLITDDPEPPWLVWCNTNYEADALRAVLPDAAEVRGSMSTDEKERILLDFSEGRAPILIAKPSIAGFGLNWQHCSKMAFVGLSYSYEQFYQAVRRCWRYGQTHDVAAHVVFAESERGVLGTLKAKQSGHREMVASMLAADHGEAKALNTTVEHRIERGDRFELHLGDCVDVMREIPDNSVGLSVFSPPFANLYVYSDALADMGNCVDHDEFFEHFAYLITELHRVTIPGRLVAVHVKDLPRYRNRDGAMGLLDFPGLTIRAFEEAGFTYHSRVTIWKDPVQEMQRTKSHGLLYKQLRADSCASRMGRADFVVAFRKWVDGMDEFPDPVTHTRDEFPLDRWQKWASPVWDDIDEIRVLPYQQAKADSDEAHLCPLQLPVIERCVGLWSNPGDLVLSPFAGIGSEGYQALLMDRRFIGMELKAEYFEVALDHLQKAERYGQQSLEIDA